MFGLLLAVHLATGLLAWRLDRADLAHSLLLSRPSGMRTLAGGQYRPLLLRGEVWRLWTSVLLHGDALHLLTNALSVASLGRILEPWIGPTRFLSWFLAGGVAGAALSHVAGVIQSDGASGGGFALLGAAVAIGWRRRADLDDEDRRLLGPVLGGFLVFNLVLSAILPFVNLAGHVGGLIAGLILGALWRGPIYGGLALHFAWIGLGIGMCVWGWGL